MMNFLRKAFQKSGTIIWVSADIFEKGDHKPQVLDPLKYRLLIGGFYA
jgi:hypothetical protein